MRIARDRRDATGRSIERHEVPIARRQRGAIEYSEDGFVVEAELIAGNLGLSPDTLRREMKRGIVYGLVERGEGGDAGRTRLTFRYRARSWSVTLKDSAD